MKSEERVGCEVSLCGNMPDSSWNSHLFRVIRLKMLRNTVSLCIIEHVCTE